MARNDAQFQPGAILHDAVMGALRSRDLKLEDWCAARGVSSGQVRNATYGIGRGPKGRELLQEVLDYAGRDLVRQSYEARLREHMAALKKGAA